MHRAIKKHKEKIAFDNWLYGEVHRIHMKEFQDFLQSTADQSERAAQVITVFARAMEDFRKGVEAAMQKAHDRLLASGHRPNYLAVTLLPERSTQKFIH